MAYRNGANEPQRSGRLPGIYHVFGQIPDVLEDAWIAVAQGERERAKKIIDALPQAHPFELQYTWEAYVEMAKHGRTWV